MQRNNYIDAIKAFAIFFIVCIHTAPFRDFKNDTVDGEFIHQIINTFSRFAVPIFFSITGYLIGKKMNDGFLSLHIKKNIFKIAKILITWSLILYPIYLLMTALNSYLQGEDVKGKIAILLSNLKITDLYYGIPGETTYHLWYLFALIWSICILAFFIKIKRINMLLVISLLLNLIGLLGQSYSIFYELPFETRDALFFGVFYVTLGYYFSKNVTHSTWNLSDKNIFLLLTLFMLMQIFESIVLVNYFGAALGNYFITTIPITILLLFLIIKPNSPRINHVFSRVGQNTLGIFVIHPLLIYFVKFTIINLGLEKLTTSFIWNILYTPIIFMISYFLYSFIQYVKRVVKSKWAKFRSSS